MANPSDGEQRPGPAANDWIELADRPTETWRRNSGTPVVRGCFAWFEPSRSHTDEPWLAGYLDYRDGVDRSVPGSNTVTRGFPTLTDGQEWIDAVIAAAVDGTSPRRVESHPYDDEQETP